jgi:hypothetical protein
MPARAAVAELRTKADEESGRNRQRQGWRPARVEQRGGREPEHETACQESSEERGANPRHIRITPQQAPDEPADSADATVSEEEDSSGKADEAAAQQGCQWAKVVHDFSVFFVVVM